MFEIKDLFELTVDGAFSSFEEFQDFANQVDNATLFSIIKPGAFADLQEFEKLKKKDESTFVAPKQDVELVTENISSVIQPQTEQDYFEGTFGDVLKGFDSVTKIGLGDFVDDMARSVATGYYQGQVAEDASDILLRGADATEEDILSYIEANKEAQKLGPSDEMMQYQKTYEENGKGFMGVLMGLYKSGFQVIPEVILSSMSSMVSNKDSRVAAGTILGAGATVGATTGAAGGTVALPVIGTVGGAAAGAITGAAATLPYAFAAAGSVLEMGATFSELLQEEIEGELTPEKIREALNDDKIYTSLRNRALARGLTIGVIDAFTGRLGGKVAGKILSKAGKGATKGTKIKSVLAASGVESVGGSFGEATARGVIGQEMDVSEIALEGIAEAPGGIKDVISARFSKPKYKVNGKKVDVETIDNLIETMTLDQLQSTKINIDNDYEGRAEKLADRVVQLNTERLILEANPDINPETLSEITKLQLELSKLDGNKTEVAKEKASVLKAKIKDLQENQLETEIVTDEDLFRDIEQNKQIKYLEQASKELVAEAEARGDEEFNITEEQSLARATELFIKDQDTTGKTETQVEETPKDITLNDLVNRPVTLTELGGSPLETPIEGDLYIEGQQVVIEDSDGNITEIGNVDEVLEKPLSEIGVKQDVSNISVNGDGNLNFNDKTLVPEKSGIKINKRGEISRVVLRSPDGSETVTLRGVNAEEAAYQILLKEAESMDNFPKSGQALSEPKKINEILEQDEEFQNEFREVEDATKTETGQDTTEVVDEKQEVEVEGEILMTPKEIIQERFKSIKARNEAERKGDDAEVERQIKRTEYLDSLFDQKTKTKLKIQSDLYSKDAVNKKIEKLKKDPFFDLGWVNEEIKLLEEVLEEYNKIEALETKKESTKDTATIGDLDNQIEEAKQKIESYKKFDKISVKAKPKAEVKVEEQVEVETEQEKYEKGLKGLSSIALKGIENSIISAINKLKIKRTELGKKFLPNYKGKLTEQDNDNFEVVGNKLFGLENNLKSVKKAIKNEYEISIGAALGADRIGKTINGKKVYNFKDSDGNSYKLKNNKKNKNRPSAEINTIQLDNGKWISAKSYVINIGSQPSGMSPLSDTGNLQFATEQEAINHEAKKLIEDANSRINDNNTTQGEKNEWKRIKKWSEDVLKDNPTKATPKAEVKVEKQVDNAKKALNKLDKDIKIVIHNDDSSYRKATGEDTREQSTRGEYNPTTKTININATKAQANTVAHEVFHALLLRNGITNKQAKAITDRMLKAVKKTASPELLQKLKEHSENYESALQSEESIAELFGILASEYKSLDKPTQSIVKRWINKLANILGVKKFTDAEVIDLLNVVSAKVEAGQEITEQDVAILDGSVSGVVNGKARKQDSVLTSFTLKRFPTNPNIKLSEDTPLSNFNQKKSNLLESDRMTGAFIPDAKNNPVFKFFGGIYFPQITGKWWASRTISKATSIAENMNANRDKDGYIYATPIIMKPNSHMSNQDMFETVWEFMKFDLRSKSSKVTKKLFSEYLTKALTLKSVNLTESDLNIKKSDNIETMITKLNKVLLGDDTTLSFEKRKAIIKAILGDPKVTEDRKFPTAGSISEVASKFEEEKTKQATKLWDIVMLMRTKGTLSTKITPKSDEFYHKSYPAEISSDQEIEVFFLDGAYNIDTTYPELNQSSGKVFSWKEYSEKHPTAAMALSQYGRTAKLSKASGDIVAPQSRKQISEKVKQENEMGKLLNPTRVFVAGIDISDIIFARSYGKSRIINEKIKSLKSDIALAKKLSNTDKIETTRLRNALVQTVDISVSVFKKEAKRLQSKLTKKDGSLNNRASEKIKNLDSKIELLEDVKNTISENLFSPSDLKITDTPQSRKQVTEVSKSTPIPFSETSYDKMSKAQKIFTENLRKKKYVGVRVVDNLKNKEGSDFKYQYGGLILDSSVDSKQRMDEILIEIAMKEAIENNNKLYLLIKKEVDKYGIDGFTRRLKIKYFTQKLFDDINNLLRKIFKISKDFNIIDTNNINELRRLFSPNIKYVLNENNRNRNKTFIDGVGEVSTISVNEFNQEGIEAYHSLGAYTQGRYTDADIMQYHADMMNANESEEVSGFLSNDYTKGRKGKLKIHSTSGAKMGGGIIYSFKNETPIVELYKWDATSNMDQSGDNSLRFPTKTSRSIRKSESSGKVSASELKNYIKTLKTGRTSYPEGFFPLQKGNIKSVIISNLKKENNYSKYIDILKLTENLNPKLIEKYYRSVVSLLKQTNTLKKGGFYELNENPNIESVLDAIGKAKEQLESIDNFPELKSKALINLRDANNGFDIKYGYMNGDKFFDLSTPQSRKQKPGNKPSKKPTQKRTSSIKKAITEIKNVLKITPDEQRAIFKALNDQKKKAKEIKKDIVASLRDLNKKGKITPNKMVSVINKVPDDFNNPITVERFVEYMTKVFNDADYGNKMTIANAKRGKARKNVSTKLGIAEGLVDQLQRLFSVKPSLIPDSVLDQYMELINIFGKRESVLSLPPMEQVIQLTEDILQQLDEEQSMAMELVDIYENADKVYNKKTGDLDYAATIKQMLDDEVINESQYEVMKKYKSEIKPTEPATPKTEAEIEGERQEVIKDVKETKEVDPSVFPSRLERDLAKRFKKLLKTDAINDLSLDDLKNLFKVIDNINNGYLPHYAQIMVGKMNAINDAKVGANAIKRSKLLPLSKIYANLKSKFGRTGKTPTSELQRRIPSFYIDQVFGDFKTKDIFNSIFNRSAEASAKYTKSIKEVQAKIEKVEQAVFKSFGREPNKVIMSKYKQMSYLIQQEFLSNPDSKQVNSVEDFLKATIKRIKTETTSYTENDAKMLQEILDTYTEKGTKPFDIDQLYESFNVAEKNSIRTLEEINKSMTERAVYTANIIRGTKITPLKNYTHLSVIPEVSKADIIETETSQISDMFNKYLNPSTKAKSLIERTGKVSALNFDVYASVQRGAKYTLMDFNLTEPIRTARRTLNQIEKNLSDKDGNMPANARKIFNAIRDASVESIDMLLSNALTQNTIADKAVDFIQKQGYRAILAGPFRATYEFLANAIGAVFFDPLAITTGIKNRKLLASPEGKEVMNNLNSTETNRVFSTGLSGKFVDTGILNQAAGVTASRAKGKVENTILKFWNKSGQRWMKGVEFTADTLISSPDKLVMQPMWFGAFENRFKQLTGKSPDFDKIASNDETYMDKYATELNDAKTLADTKSVYVGATDNAFMGILKGTVKPNQGTLLRGFNAFNGFMTRFLIFEYITARTGIMAAVGNGQINKRQGAALLAGVTTRMMTYTFLGTLVAEAIKDLTEDDDEDYDMSNLQFEDDDEQGMKSIEKILGQSMVSAFTSLALGRDFGNATKSIINLGIEDLNERYGQLLRDGEYDKYRDAIQYTIIPEGKNGRLPLVGDVVPNLFAAYSPMIKTTVFGINKIFESDRIEPDAIERQQDERFIRLPLEILGILGFIPLYKDVRKIVLSDMYKGLRKAKKDSANKKKRKEEMLQGYNSETDMKRYDFPLWERTFGPDSPGYDKRQVEKELKRKERKLRQQEKDKMYDYIPPAKKRKSSSSPFGPSSNKGKSSSPFG